MKQEGYLIITDISGYTSFLTKSELEHAHDILDSLFKTLLGNIKPPLMVAKLEGDAIFVFSPKGSFIQGQTLLESIENIYFAFGFALESMRLNTTCTCNACKMIPTLDLKFAIHHGEFIQAMVGGSEELSGPDVILVHRLLKNTVIESTGVKAYAFLTEAAAAAMELGEITGGMIAHTENYEHIGDVKGYVHDLKPIFAQMKARKNIKVEPDKEWIKVAADVAAPAALVWDYLNTPSLRATWMEVHSFTNQGLKSGRLDVGSVQHCAHGENKGTIPFTILDWRPFEYVTHEIPWLILNGRIMTTTTLKGLPDGGTHVEITWGKPVGNNAFHQGVLTASHVLLRGMMHKIMANSVKHLARMVSEDESSGKIVCDFVPMKILGGVAA